MSDYQIGDKPRLTATFRDVNRVIADPDTVRFRLRRPDDTESTYTFGTDVEVVRDAVGVFHFDLLFTQAGEWWFRFEAVGGFAGATEGALQVEDSHFDSVG